MTGTAQFPTTYTICAKRLNVYFPKKQIQPLLLHFNPQQLHVVSATEPLQKASKIHVNPLSSWSPPKKICCSCVVAEQNEFGGLLESQWHLNWCSFRFLIHFSLEAAISFNNIYEIVIMNQFGKLRIFEFSFFTILFPNSFHFVLNVFIIRLAKLWNLSSSSSMKL